jgi:tight adherence protein C
VIATRRAVARLGPAITALEPGVPALRRSPLALIGRIVPLTDRSRSTMSRAAGEGSADELAGRKVMFAALGALAGIVLTTGLAAFAAAPLFAGAGWRLPDLRLQRRAREAEEQIRAALPDALDLLAACALSGMSLDRSLRTVAPDVDGALGVALRAAVRALDVGMPRAQAYAILCERAPVAEIRILVRALERAERYGTSVATTLVAQGREMRSRRRAAIEQAARAAPVKMLFPLVVCFLPAFVILTVAPVVLTALRSFQTK